VEPETRYARSGDVSIAYQVTGDGPFDVVRIPAFMSHVELEWEIPKVAEFFRRLSSSCRLIRFDKRGTGMSDRVADMPTLETRMDDVRAVMDAAGSERAALLGHSEGVPMSILFAATYPDRCWALVLDGGFARERWAPDYPWGVREEEYREFETSLQEWGTTEHSLKAAGRIAPSADDENRAALARMIRSAASPGAALALDRMNRDIDGPGIVQSSRFIAENIAGARRLELPGEDHTMFTFQEHLVPEIERFLGEAWADRQTQAVEPDRVLATVLFTDIVGSTARAAELGDARWRELLGAHHDVIRRQLVRFRGKELDTAGDGFFALFDGPARAIRCACAVTEAVRELGIEVRAGLHTGECEQMDGKVGGIAVHIGARVASEAEPGEVLVSSTVKDLVAGSGIAFAERGSFQLKGVPDEWRLYAVERET
jgi:class 3 adenylate cyclase